MSDEKLAFARLAFEARAISHGELVKIESGESSYLVDSFYQAHKYLIGEMSAKLTAERNTAWQELREIREAIGVNPEESTADEVRRVVAQKDNLHKALEQFQAQSTHWHQQSQQLTAQNAELVAQVEALRQACLDWENTETPNAWQLIFDEIKRCANTEPPQPLRDRDAEVGRAGFLEGVRQMAGNEIGWFGHDADSCANHYAAKVRIGEL